MQKEKPTFLNKPGDLLKISGEFFASAMDSETGKPKANHEVFDHDRIMAVADLVVQYQAVTQTPTLLVLGGGNLCRGRELDKFKFRNGRADHIGMSSTIQNALILKYVLEELGKKARVMAPFAAEMIGIEPYKAGKAKSWAEDGTFVIFGGGTGLSGFSTDMVAVSRAYETGCQNVVKLTEANYLFTADPKKDPAAKIIPEITYAEVIRKGLSVMDAEAFIFASDERKGLTIKIAGLSKEILKPDFIQDRSIGSIVTHKLHQEKLVIA